MKQRREEREELGKNDPGIEEMGLGEWEGVGRKLSSISGKQSFRCCASFHGNTQQTFGICLETGQAGAGIVDFDEIIGTKITAGGSTAFATLPVLQQPLPCVCILGLIVTIVFWKSA